MIKGQKALFLSGQDIFIPECNIVIKQPTIKEVALFGEDSFLTACQLFGKTETFTDQIRAGNEMLSQAPDFQLLLIIINQQESLKESVNAFFELTFPLYRVDITDNMINFFYEDNLVGQIQPYNFEPFKETIREIYIPNICGQSEEIEYNPANDKAKEIAEKIKKGRAKIAQLRMTDADENASLFAKFCSVLSVGLSMDITILYNYTPYQLYDCFNRYLLKVKNDFYMKVSTTPLMDTSKMDEPEDWMKNI